MRLFLLVLVLLTAPALAETGEVLFKDQHWRVEQRGNLRVLLAHQGGYWAEQSRMDSTAPSQPILPYTRLQLNSSRAVAAPRRILVVGLGAASLTKALRQNYPQAELVGIEIDPLVVKLAREFFHYQESELTKTVIGDARQVLASGGLGKFDLIYLDAFDGTEIPEPLREIAFFNLVAEHLAPGGVVVTNLHRRSKLFDEDLRRLGTVFPYRYGKEHMVQTMILAGFQPISLEDWTLLLQEEKGADHGQPQSAQNHRE